MTRNLPVMNTTSCLWRTDAVNLLSTHLFLVPQSEQILEIYLIKLKGGCLINLMTIKYLLSD